jgi:hypothetical protein
MLLCVTWDDYLTFLMALLLIAVLLRIARSLWRGRVKSAGETWRRDEAPFEYWLEIGFDVFAAILLGAALALPSERALLVLSVAAPSLVRDFRARKSRAGPPGPSTAPGEIRLLVLIYAAIAAAAIALFYLTVHPF